MVFFLGLGWWNVAQGDEGNRTGVRGWVKRSGEISQVRVSYALSGLEGLLVGGGEAGAGAEVEPSVLGALEGDDEGDLAAEQEVLGGVRLGPQGFPRHAVGLRLLRGPQGQQVGREAGPDLALVVEADEVLARGAEVGLAVLERQHLSGDGHAALERRQRGEAGLERGGAGGALAEALEVGRGELAGLGQAADEQGALAVADLPVVLAGAHGDIAEDADAAEDGLADLVAFEAVEGHADEAALARLDLAPVVVVGVLERGFERIVEFGVGLSERDERGVAALALAHGGGGLLQGLELEVAVAQAEAVVGAGVADSDVRGGRLVERDADVAREGAAVLALARQVVGTEVALGGFGRVAGFGLEAVVLPSARVEHADEAVVLGLEVAGIVDAGGGVVAHGGCWVEGWSGTGVPVAVNSKAPLS